MIFSMILMKFWLVLYGYPSLGPMFVIAVLEMWRFYVSDSKLVWLIGSVCNDLTLHGYLGPCWNQLISAFEVEKESKEFYVDFQEALGSQHGRVSVKGMSPEIKAGAGAVPKCCCSIDIYAVQRTDSKLASPNHLTSSNILMLLQADAMAGCEHVLKKYDKHLLKQASAWVCFFLMPVFVSHFACGFDWNGKLPNSIRCWIIICPIKQT